MNAQNQMYLRGERIGRAAAAAGPQQTRRSHRHEGSIVLRFHFPKETSKEQTPDRKQDETEEIECHSADGSTDRVPL